MRKIILSIALLSLASCRGIERITFGNDGDKEPEELRIVFLGQSQAVSKDVDGMSSASTLNTYVKINKTLGIDGEYVTPKSSGTLTHSLAWVFMADKLSSYRRRQVRICNLAEDGTNSKAWHTRVKFNVFPEIEKFDPHFIVWLHGETDSRGETSVETYFLRISKMIKESKQYSAAPWVIALNSHPKYSDGSLLVREAQKRLIDEGYGMEGPDVDTLRLPGLLYDGLHFNQQGLKRHGELWASWFLWSGLNT